MPLSPKISALIITYNEENNIRFLLDLLDFADEIIVVDSFSTDHTAKIVLEYPKVQLVQNTFENFAQQRNFALSLARNPWILFLDADERLTPHLKNEIVAITQLEKPKTAYYFKRDFIFKKKKLRFSGWQTDKIIRLFQKEQAHYNQEKIVHEKLIINGETGILKNKLIHFSYTNFQDYKSKMIQYGKLKAIEEIQKGTQPNLYHFYLRPTYQFMYQYFIRFGVFDGKKGIVICYLNALSVYVRFQELKDILQKN